VSPARSPACFEQVADKSVTKICHGHVGVVIDLSGHIEIDLAGSNMSPTSSGRRQVLGKFEAMKFRK